MCLRNFKFVANVIIKIREIEAVRLQRSKTLFFNWIKIIFKFMLYVSKFDNIVGIMILQGGWTSLMWACYKGRTSCVEELIKRGANVNIKAMV